ncbi:MAG: NTP transferase domain-containing protein [Simkaniaceae bacterium]|nr:NTP transferase domain-containing protein [Simkaniaceae bacterium]
MDNYARDEEFNVATIILAGGQGTRLYPLTETRCKPDVIFGGKYRLIDIPLSASINSGIPHIFVIAQYLASHLNKHIRETYQLTAHNQIDIQLLSPEETLHDKLWYRGTADAVRKNLEHLLDIPSEYYLILSGDHLYSMDLRKLLKFAMTMEADLTIASIPVGKKDAPRMGLLQIDEERWVQDFYEKPTEESILNRFKMPKKLAEGCFKTHDQSHDYLASMGIYVFKRDVLIRLLDEVKGDDFGKDLIPHFVRNKGKIASFIYQGYWEDIGTVYSYYHATMALLSNRIGLNFYDESYPIYAQVVNLPCPLITNGSILNSIICDGSIIKEANVVNSLIGLRTYILEGSTIKNSIVMGNPHYFHQEGDLPTDIGHYTIGKNCHIENAIIDENAQIGNNVTLVNKDHIEHFDGDDICIREGIIIVKAGAKIPDDTTLQSLAA